MADPLTDILASVRTRLQEELDAQIRAVTEKHAEAVALARREAELEADQRWSALLEEARGETQHQLDAAVALARQEAADTAREAAEAARTQVPAEQDPSTPALLAGLARIQAADSLTTALNAIAQSASELGESTLFVLAGSELHAWPHAEGIHAVDELSRDALASRSPVRSDAAIAVPLLLDDGVVAVLYGKRPDSGGGPVFDAFEALARSGAAHLANLTLLRTAQAQRWMADTSRLYGSAPRTDTPEDTSEDEAAGAKRFARLLVSEIKLYNEGAVRVGRERRDLLQRLGEDIDRARRLYEERVPPTVPGRAQHFHNELVQTLAGGDPALLG